MVRVLVARMHVEDLRDTAVWHQPFDRDALTDAIAAYNPYKGPIAAITSDVCYRRGGWYKSEKMIPNRDMRMSS